MPRRARLVLIAVWIVVGIVALVGDYPWPLLAAAVVGIVTQLVVLRAQR
jgi:hypothetical protein